MIKKPLNIWQMITINFGFFGIQFGWALQMANMSIIYKFLGAASEHIAILWLAAPMTGLIVQPLLGYLSDKTWSRRLGRRRPYILGGAVFSSLALFIMPNSYSLMMAAVLLWVLDASINVTMQPYRSIVADVAPCNQHTKCYAIQTCLVGIGSTLASVLPWILLHVFNVISNTGEGMIPLTLKISFYVGAAVFLVANLFTVIFSKEYPPEVEDSSCKVKESPSVSPENKKLIPKTMWQISWVQFFTWMGLFCMFLFFGLGTAQNIFGLLPNANTTLPKFHSMLEQGAALGGLCFGIYTFVSFIYAYLIPSIAKILSRKGAHSASLLIGGLCLIVANLIHSSNFLLATMIGVGIAWASIVTIPYAILAGNLPEKKIGFYMGLFNLTICIPEIIAALFLGKVLQNFFSGHAMQVVALGGGFMIVAAILTLLVEDRKIETFV